ncbi:MULTISPECIES: TetR/AcrR family transcriptional regulator [Streptomyces]|uniref:TetR family transcriptional regulator n=1 Tax=Streptomyces odorifer TaxID=53450 RepID=A0A7Y6F5L9_9ACTN|nr:TetR/AcrR family transcriptional regulator C-terminal domain-containing protein [Streptomyces odorifer]NUV32278.1 TetR family transcriptional regulator [Streptomyces odorifer]NUV36035.1 TetR family transcriptional regulator [Streptomyces sp. KAI-27]NUV48858.1 TetR family transcriptional regulator [Streptomyces sp. CAI-78]
MSSRREPTSRRDRPAKPALSRQWIVAAALGIMREEGLEKVTMRRLAQELDTGPASLYVYVANTAALHAAVLDALLGDVDLSGDDEGGDGDWREQLRAVLRSYTLVLFAYPQLARSALVARPSGENYLRLVERVLVLLSRGGAGREQAAWGVDTLLQSATATAAEQATRERDPAATDEWNATVQALGAASEAVHPAISAYMPALVAGSPEERFRWGFDVLVNGILATPAPDASA